MKDTHRGRAIQQRLPAGGSFNWSPSSGESGLVSALVPKFKVWEWLGSSPGSLGLVSRMESPDLEQAQACSTNWGGGGERLLE